MEYVLIEYQHLLQAPLTLHTHPHCCAPVGELRVAAGVTHHCGVLHCPCLDVVALLIHSLQPLRDHLGDELLGGDHKVRVEP